MKKYILHVDANSAYLSWTAADMLYHGSKIDLRTVPSVIGGSEKSRHGIVLAKSIPAKQFGIKTGEPLRDARSKCPKLLIYPPDYDLYMKASAAMVEIINEYSPRIQRFSIDECFFDYYDNRDARHIVEVANEIRNRIHQELGFTVNIGISTNKLLAKMGGELKKPNLVNTLFKNEIKTKMWPLPVGELFMVGRKTEEKLRIMGIKTIGELAQTNPKYLYDRMKSHGYLVHAYANGIDDSIIRKNNYEVAKGIGNGTTVPFDVWFRWEANLVMLSLAESVGTRLRAAGFCTGLVAIGVSSIRNGVHFGGQRQRKLSIATDSTSYIHMMAMELFDELWDFKAIRKLRLRVSDLHTNEYIQLSYFEQFDFENHKLIDKTIDRIRGQYGSQAIFRASFIDSGLRPISGGVQDDGEDSYPLMTSIL